MKKTILFVLLLISAISYSQTQYYTTNGKDMLNEEQVLEMASQVEEGLSKRMKKKMYATIVIEETETKKDSVISKVSIALNEKKPESLFSEKPLSKLKNKELPAYDFTTLNGEKFTFEKLKGKPTMINFWFTSCKPCVDEIPVLNKIKEMYKDDFNFVSITYESKEDVAAFIKKHPFEFTHLIDAKEFTNLLQIQSYPKNFFLDKNGKLVYHRDGIPYETDENSDELIIGSGKEFMDIIEKMK